MHQATMVCCGTAAHHMCSTMYNSLAQSLHPWVPFQALANPLPTSGGHPALHVSACAHEYPTLTCTRLQSQRADGDSIFRVHDALFCVVCFYGLVLVFSCALDWIVWGDQLDNICSILCAWKVVRTRLRLELNLDRIGYLFGL